MTKNSASKIALMHTVIEAHRAELIEVLMEIDTQINQEIHAALSPEDEQEMRPFMAIIFAPFIVGHLLGATEQSPTTITKAFALFTAGFNHASMKRHEDQKRAAH